MIVVNPPDVWFGKCCHTCAICGRDYKEEEMIYDNLVRRWYCDDCWGLLSLDIEDSLE